MSDYKESKDNPLHKEFGIWSNTGFIIRKTGQNVKGGEIAAGDPILLYCSNCKDGRPFVHSLFFVGWSENGYAKIYCHNNRNVGVVNRWPACYACHARLREAHVMHINGNSPLENDTYPKNSFMHVGSITYHINAKGVKDTGFTKVGDNWYYFNLKGEMQTGWKHLNNRWYYFDSEGKMADGITEIDGKSYIFVNGAMRTGWIKLEEKWYYLEKNGVMVAGNRMISGKLYKFGKDGVCQNP